MGNKNERVKRMVLVLALVCVFMISGGTCVYAGAEIPENPGMETAGTPDSGRHPVSSIAFLREWIEENNRMDEEMEQQGFHSTGKILYLSFAEDSEPYAQAGTIAAEDSGIHATAVMRIEDAKSSESSGFSVTAVLLMNGKPVDFRLDGNSSEGGILTVSLNSNQDYIMHLSAEDLPVMPGENKLLLIAFGYCMDQDFYLDPCYTKGSFLSDAEYDGAAITPCPEGEIDAVSIRDKGELGAYIQQMFLSDGEMTDFQSDHYGNFLMTSRPDPTMHFYLDNMSVQGLYNNSKGILFLFIDGKLMPVWNGNCFGEMSVRDGDLLRVIRVKSGFRAGEQHHIYWCYQETEGAEEWPLCMRYRMKMKIE